jgi:hypothetical protein
LRQAAILLTLAYALVAVPLGVLGRHGVGEGVERTPIASRGTGWRARDGTSRLSRRLY